MSEQSKPPAYFIVTGRTEAAILAFFAAQTAHIDHMRAIANDLGCTGPLWRTGEDIRGFSVPPDGTIPAGLRRDRRSRDILVPYISTAAGKAIRKRMNAAPPAMSVRAVMDAAGLDTAYRFTANKMFGPSAGFRKLGDVWIMELSTDDKGEPDRGVPHDSERIPASRYWAMVEAHEAAAAS